MLLGVDGELALGLRHTFGFRILYGACITQLVAVHKHAFYSSSIAKFATAC